MSRFGSEGEEMFANQYDLWCQSYRRALNSPRGQQALLDLYHALHALPSKRLISSSLAYQGEVCAVGALALYRRTQAGEDAAAVLADLEGAAPVYCSCGCYATDHGLPGTPCGGCIARTTRYEERRDPAVHPYLYDVCTGFVYDPEYQDHDEWTTVDAGTKVGVARTLAWQLGYLNDEELGRCTPEERWAKVEAWVVEHLLPVPVA